MSRRDLTPAQSLRVFCNRLQRGSSRSERGNVGLCAAENQGVYVVGALIGVHHLQVHQMARSARRP